LYESTHFIVRVCPICAGDTELFGYGVIAPFISECSHMPRDQVTELLCCSACDFQFFSIRYGPKELSSIYSAYRSPEYLRLRRSWEPWYSERINDATSVEKSRIDRKKFMNLTLEDALPKEINCAVDFGGDEGQFFPDIQINRRIVLDLSEHPLHDGVERINSLGDLGDKRVDLVIVSHVLEHLTDPVQTLQDLHGVMSEDGILYVEVPMDRFVTHSSLAKKPYRDRVRRYPSHKLIFIMRDFITGVSRQYRTKIPRWGVIKQSEHINYFSGTSVQRLLTKSGFLIVATAEDRNHKVGGARFGRYGVTARRLPVNRS